jgi:hypothetical protein
MKIITPMSLIFINLELGNLSSLTVVLELGLVHTSEIVVDELESTGWKLKTKYK